MRTIEIQLFTFPELSETAKEKAIEAYRYGLETCWGDESLESIHAFVNHFGASLRNWSIGAYAPIDFDCQYFNSHFRGLKLRDFNRDYMPTGYCLDCDLWVTFYDEFKRTGSAKKAFDAALYAGFKAWRADIEWQLSDEAISETLDCVGYEFTEAGVMQ
jgi:hypothetical protein